MSEKIDVKEKIRENLLIVLDEAVQMVYEISGADYTELSPDVRRVVIVLHDAQKAVLQEL